MMENASDILAIIFLLLPLFSHLYWFVKCFGTDLCFVFGDAIHFGMACTQVFSNLLPFYLNAVVCMKFEGFYWLTWEYLWLWLGGLGLLLHGCGRNDCKTTCMGPEPFQQGVVKKNFMNISLCLEERLKDSVFILDCAAFIQGLAAPFVEESVAPWELKENS